MKYYTVKETEKSVTYHIELPGAKRENVSVVIDRGYLKISAEFKSPIEGDVKYRQSFQLRSEVDTTKATAKVEDGILTVELPYLAPPTYTVKID